MLTNRHILSIAASVLPLTLAGCRSGYDVDVRNLADQPIVASIISEHPNGGGRILSSTRLGPGDRAGLFAQTESREHVRVEADFAGNTGYPATMDLVRGRTVVNIRRAEDGSKGRLTLQEVPRP